MDRRVFIPKDFPDKIKNCLIKTVKDIKEDIQLEVISCMKYLQDTQIESCKVISSLIFILEFYNGLSLKVRLKILEVIVVNYMK